MSIKSTSYITREHAIIRIKEVTTMLKEKNYREITEHVFEPDINIQKAIDNWEPIDLSDLDKWTDKMLEDYMDNPFFRHSMFDNYLIEAPE